MFPPRSPFRVGPPKPDARRRALTLWRRVDLVPEEVALARTEKQAGTLVAGVLKGLRLERRQAEAEIVKVWNHLMAPDVAGHAQPAGVWNGTLFVNVDSSVWLSEIVRYRRREILDRLRHSFGPEMIKRISFRLG